MRVRGTLTLTEVLNEAGELTPQAAAPWVGLLWLGSLPLRFAQCHLAAQIIDLGRHAREYGDYLNWLALLVGLTFIPATLSRAAFVRACELRLRTRRAAAGEALRLPAAATACYLYTAFLCEACFWATCVTWVTGPPLILVAGLAAATFSLNDRPSLSRPLALIFEHGQRLGVLLGLLTVFGAAWLLATANLYFVFAIGHWAAGGAAGLDLVRWGSLLSADNPRFVLSLGVGGILLVEPFWLSALTVYVHKVRARRSGEDLRLWFAALKSEAL